MSEQKSTSSTSCGSKNETTNIAINPPLPAPVDGGTVAWLFVFAAFLLFFTTWGPSTSAGAFQEFYQRDLLAGYSPSAISWIGTVNAALLISTGVLAGPLFDRGFVRHLMVLGSIMVVFGQMMLSLSTSYYQVMLSQGFCIGIGAGLIYVPAIAMVNTQFTTKRALAMGIVTSGASLGECCAESIIKLIISVNRLMQALDNRWSHIPDYLYLPRTPSWFWLDCSGIILHSAWLLSCGSSSPLPRKAHAQTQGCAQYHPLACPERIHILCLWNRELSHIYGILYPSLLRTLFCY